VGSRPPPAFRYVDPLDQIWVSAAAQIGFRIERTAAAYASTDGRRTIYVGTTETLDADDSLAQMIFHELCHALVEGEAGEARVDWGLENTDDRDLWREWACLRLQTHLAGRFGLRRFFAPTTDHRAWWETLGADPFAAPAAAGGRREASVVAARRAAVVAERPPWAPHLHAALAATAELAAAVAAVGSAPVGPGTSGPAVLPPLWRAAEVPPALAASGKDPRHPDPTHRCGACAWRDRRGRCMVSRRGVAEGGAACIRFEPGAELDCLTCGACCREAYHAVDVGPRELVIKRHPALVVFDAAGRAGLGRAGERCAALAGGHTPHEPYRCTIYADRPRTCRDFTLGSTHCRDARRRVGLSL
jgi:hypothetical protein